MMNGRAMWAIFGVFFVESAVLGNWIPRIPDVKAALQLSDAALGLCLLAIPLGTISGLLVAGRIIEHTGLRGACRLFLPIWALLFILPAFATSVSLLASSLFACGVSVGLIEVAMNTEAARFEQSGDQRLMSRCHGFWSLGSMTGALCGSVFASYGISVQAHFSTVLPVLAIAGWWVASQLPLSLRPTGTAPVASDALFRLPSSAVLLLCMMPLGIMAVEGAFIDWSAVFMRSILNASPADIGIAYAFFSGVMAVTRLLGDRLAERFGDLAIVRLSGVAATLGITLFALAPTVIIACGAAALSGMGVAIVYPLAVSAAARRPGRTPADNVAALTMVSFSAFLFAPPFIGFLSEAIGLRRALLALAPLAFFTVLLAREVVRPK